MNATDIISGIGSVEELRAAAERGLAPEGTVLNNMHVHLPPNFSAFDTIQQVVDLAAEQDIRMLGVTNYYYHDVYDSYAELAGKAKVFPLFGLEIISQIDELTERGVRINDPNNPGRMYICGKGISRFAAPPQHAAELMDFIRQSDEKRMAEITEKLSAIFTERGLEISLTADDIVQRVAKRHACSPDTIILQERHLAQAFQEELFDRVPADSRIEVLNGILGVESTADPEDVVKIQGEIRTHLIKAGKPAFVTEGFISLQEAFELILGMGGIPCYPTLADGSAVLCEYEEDPAVLVDHIKSNNIHCAEFIPIRNEPDVLERYVKTMRNADLVVVAGTEHNTLDLLPINPYCKKGQEITDDVRAIFLEGAYVCAAHLFLTLHGECGFVDGEGNPNANFGSPAERIEYFSRLGAAVVRKYLER